MNLESCLQAGIISAQADFILERRAPRSELTVCDESINVLLQLLPARETASDLPVLRDDQRVPGV